MKRVPGRSSDLGPQLIEELAGLAVAALLAQLDAVGDAAEDRVGLVHSDLPVSVGRTVALPSDMTEVRSERGRDTLYGVISPEPTRALVLGGGGLAGIAWEVGLLVGLADAGLDVTGADRVIGTSAGSVVGALVTTGVDLAEVHARHGDVEAMTAAAGPAVELDMEALGSKFLAAMVGAHDAREIRARIGSVALTAETVPEAQRREVIAGRLPVPTWSDRDLRITAVDAASGELAVFERGDGAGLVDAVAASCAVPGVWPPVTIDGHRYVDGGVASVVHVDLADRPDAVDRVLVIAPLDPPPGGPFPTVGLEVTARRGAHPDGTILAVLADDESQSAFGGNVLDPAAMPPSAAAGRAQGRAVAEEVARLWS